MEILSGKEIATTGYAVLLNSIGFEIVFDGTAQIYLPCGKRSSRDLRNKMNTSSINYFMQNPCSTYLTSKNKLWVSMIRFHGFSKTLEILPKTYVLNSERDLFQLKELFKIAPVQMIAKGNKQARKTIKVFNSIAFNDILSSDEYVVVQEIVDSRNIITESAFNIRIYLMVCYQNRKMKAFFSSNGKLIYSKNGSELISSTNNYDSSNPLLLSELFAKHSIDFTRKDFNKQTKTICKKLMKMLQSKLSALELDPDKRFCQLFGVDLIMDSNHKLKLLEVNLRPDMKSTFEHEREFKYHIFSDWINAFLLKNSSPQSDWVSV